MTKRHASSLLLLYRGILEDAVALDKSLAGGVIRDLSRLTSLVAEHGMTVFTVMLPAIGKLLDRSLDDGRLDLRHLPLTRPASRSTKIPRLFQGIWLRVFDECGVLRSIDSLDPAFVFVLRQLLYAGKKIELSPSSRSKFLLVKEFFDVESHLPKPSNFWFGNANHYCHADFGSLLDLCQRDFGGSTVFRHVSEGDYPLLLTAQQIADRFVVELFPGILNLEELRPRHGPGATAEYRRGGGYKYSFPTWSSRLEETFPFLTFGVSTPEVGLDRSFKGPIETDYPSRLVEVPKDGKGPRLIAAEPDANQWIQQGLAGFITQSLRLHEITSIDFRRQELSRERALAGSRDGSLATVDLKSASDRLSCWLVQRLFRANRSLLEAMAACRTRYMCNDIDKKLPSLIELRKFATMGSALTFPLQSITFLVLTLAAYCYTRGIPPKRWRQGLRDIQVYGDDIVVPVDSLDALHKILSAVGLLVNRDKTFGNGNFREACGLDAFRGYDVTPVKPRKIPHSSDSSSIISAVDVSNLLHSKLLWRSAKRWRSLVDTFGLVPLVRHGGRAWGDRTFCKVARDHDLAPKAKFRFSPHLHRDEFLLLQPYRLVREEHRSEGWGNLLQYFTEDPSLSEDLNTFESGVVVSRSDVALRRRWVSSDLIREAGIVEL